MKFFRKLQRKQIFATNTTETAAPFYIVIYREIYCGEVYFSTAQQFYFDSVEEATDYIVEWIEEADLMAHPERDGTSWEICPVYPTGTETDGRHRWVVTYDSRSGSVERIMMGRNGRSRSEEIAVLPIKEPVYE